MKQYNEFVVKFANINGSGSASTNSLFAKALFRTGITVSSKNIFPSNIQGLPTWYAIRVSEKGYTGNRAGVDVMVAMNIATYAKDLESVLPGGCFLYDSTWDREFNRDDVKVLGIPLTRLVMERFGEVKQRFFYKNMACCGALSALLELDTSHFADLVKQQYASKPKLIPSNIEAFELGVQWVKDNVPADFLDVAIKTSGKIGESDRVLISGNEASGLGSVFAGASVAAWYPITPSTSVAEGFTKYCEQLRHPNDKEANYAIVQAEDEIAAIGMAVGAGWNGARSFTATSGPGISLMSEILGLAYFAEIPVVIFNVQRGGPSTGMPTRTQQSDLLLCAYASHGDTIHPMLFPANPKECFDMAINSFDAADRLQTPVFVMLDLDLGMNDWVSEPFDIGQHGDWDRGKVMTKKMLDEIEGWGRYLDMDGDGIPYRSLPGVHESKGSYLTRGTSHDEHARYTEDGVIHARMIDRIRKKFDASHQYLPEPDYYGVEKKQHKHAALFFGTTESSMIEARDYLAQNGVELDLIRLRSFPFHPSLIERLAEYDSVFVVEQNRDGQLRKLLIAETPLLSAKMVSIPDYIGAPVNAKSLVEKISVYFPATKVATAS